MIVKKFTNEDQHDCDKNSTIFKFQFRDVVYLSYPVSTAGVKDHTGILA